MKKIKPVHVAPRSDWYRLKSHKVLDQKLLDSIDWAKDKPYVSFIFPEVKLSSVKNHSFGLSRKYMASTHCMSGRGGIKVPPAPASLAGIEARPPKSLAEFRRLNRVELNAVLKKEGKKAGYSVHNDYKFYEKNIMPKAKALLFFRKGKFAGMAVHFKSENFGTGKCDHIGWHHDPKGFTPAERRSAEYQQALWLKKTVKGRLSAFSDGLHGPYYNFLSNLGLMFDRVRIERI